MLVTNSEAQDRWIAIRWPNGIECPRCGEGNPYSMTMPTGIRRWRCRSVACAHDFRVMQDTITKHPKKPFEWYEDIIRALVKGSALTNIGNQPRNSCKGAWNAATNILGSLPVADGCGHYQPLIFIARPIVKISPCSECGQLYLWRQKKHQPLRAFVSPAASQEEIFHKILTLCLRPGRI